MSDIFLLRHRSGAGPPSNHLSTSGAPVDAVPEEPPPPVAPSFRLLFVCTGNMCRSPIAERLMVAALGGGSRIVVESAGTAAMPGSRMTPEAVRVLAEKGAGPGGFTARRLTSQLVGEADLVLAATREHRARVVSLYPPAAVRVFTIVEFGTLAEAVRPGRVTRYTDPVERARGLLAEVHMLRGLVRVDQPDVADPYGCSMRAYRISARRISGALAAPLDLLTAGITHPQELCSPG
ncbi:arsenate reductase/protein-tyrosine-phosphatase family protein [Sphaerisporangium corydalis]|uniref:Phosphotyrosine protein phosphatase I domain-containing protein n=1 Tax=Sphaerisporangium corydalis TaxID=1441875 RepID=A0ABV9EL36_9ACTN|nr:hypothetical protein [Sphaerisporangium corydalis]